MPEILKRWDGSKWVVVGPVNLNNRNGGGTIELTDDAVYPSIISSGDIVSVSGISTITGTTPGNFLLAFFISRSDSPVINAPGWRVWGGFAPIRRDATATQRVWVLTKQSTGSDSIKFTTGGAGAEYIIYYEFAAADVDLQNPLYIGPSPALGEDETYILLSKNVNKLVIWAGHSCYFTDNQSVPIWHTTSGLPIEAGPDGFIDYVTIWNTMLGTLADTSRITDWATGGYTTSACKANMRYSHGAGGICSILPVAINHA